jgi:hypothetical protein
LKIEAQEHALIEALMLAGRLNERQALCRDEVTRAAEGVLREFASRWRNGSKI